MVSRKDFGRHRLWLNSRYNSDIHVGRLRKILNNVIAGNPAGRGTEHFCIITLMIRLPVALDFIRRPNFASGFCAE